MIQKPSTGESVIRGLHGLNRAFTIFKIVVWTIFLLLFPPVCLANGLYGAALLLAVLGMFADLMVYRRGVLPLERETQRNLFRLFIMIHVLMGSMALFLMLRPLDGGWTMIEGTRDWSDSVPVAMGESRFALFTTAEGVRKVLITADRGKTWKDTGYPGGFGWKIHYLPDRGELWVLPRKETVIHKHDPAKGAWERTVRPPGEQFHSAPGVDCFYFVTAGRLYTYIIQQNVWVFLNKAGFSINSVAASLDRKQQTVLIVGREWIEGKGSDWRFVKPAGVTIDRPEAALGGEWRYVYEGGLLSGTLYAASPGEAFVKRELPAPDIRTMAVNPADGKEVWIGTWGQGIFRSIDGAATWQYMGLRRIQAAHLAVDFGTKTVMVASANLMFHRGLYLKRYE